jgi:hypothetical protein
MDLFWQQHWWLILILAVLAVPIVQAIFAPWGRYLQYRERRAAIDALKVYAAQGREPPPDVIDALAPRRWRRRAARAAADMGGIAMGAAMGGVGAAADLDSWQTRRWDRWRRREPLRRWNAAIFAAAITAGFAFAWQSMHHDNELFLVVAIIAGALTVAAVLSALVATFWRID